MPITYTGVKLGHFTDDYKFLQLSFYLERRNLIHKYLTFVIRKLTVRLLFLYTQLFFFKENLRN